MRTLTLFGAVLASVIVSGTAVAQSKGPLQRACTAEITKFCADKKPGGGQLRSCLVANKAAASDACKAALDKAAAKK